jgi:hypothetical protein
MAQLGAITREANLVTIRFERFVGGIPALGQSVMGNYSLETIPIDATREWDLEFKAFPSRPGTLPTKYTLRVDKGRAALLPTEP